MPSLKENIDRVAAYYKARAPEYHETTGYGLGRVDDGYSPLKKLYQDTFRGHSVLEIACGTGYWTEAIARTARSILATDIHSDLIETTRNRLAAFPNARCQIADAYTLDTVDGKFSAAFAQYWWSHIPKKMQASFLDTLHGRLQPGSIVLFTDNQEYDTGSTHRRVDEHGDSYEERQLRDGSRFETIKNFTTEADFKRLLGGVAEDIQFIQFDTGNSRYEPAQLWTLSYRLKS